MACYNSSSHELAAAGSACCRQEASAARFSSHSSSRTTELASSLRCHDQCAEVALTTLSRPCPKLASLIIDNGASLWFFSKLTNQHGQMSDQSIYEKISGLGMATSTAHFKARPSLLPPSPMVMYTGPHEFASLSYTLVCDDSNSTNWDEYVSSIGDSQQNRHERTGYHQQTTGSRETLTKRS